MHNFCPHICSCSETNPEGRGVLQSWQRNVVIGSHFAEVRWFRDKREQKATALNAVTSNTIASLHNCLTFVVRFVVDRRESSLIDSFIIHVNYSFYICEQFKYLHEYESIVIYWFTLFLVQSCEVIIFQNKKNINLCEVLVLSDVRPSKNLTFCNVWARKGSSLCNRVRLNFQVCALRYIKMADW